jgi:hypothetical protein
MPRLLPQSSRMKTQHHPRGFSSGPCRSGSACLPRESRDYIISAGVWCVIESMVTCFIGKEVGNAAQFFGNR